MTNLSTIPASVLRTTGISNTNILAALFGVAVPSIVPSVAVYLFLAVAGSFGLFSRGLTLATNTPDKHAQVLTLSVCRAFCTGVNSRNMKRTGTIVFFMVITIVTLARLVLAHEGRMRRWYLGDFRTRLFF